VNNLRFADGIGLLTKSGPKLQNTTTQIDETSRKFSLMINAEKIKTMVIEKRKETPLSIKIQGKSIEQVEQFVCITGRANKRRWQRRIRLTKENWTHFTSIWNDDHSG